MEVFKINTGCYVSFPKKEIILGADLKWKNFSDLKEGNGNPTLFVAEQKIAANASQWFSQNGITASSYTEKNITKTISAKIGESPVLSGSLITEEEMKVLTRDGVYPKELMRGPLSRSEKVGFMHTLTSGGVWGFAKEESCDAGNSGFIIVAIKKKQVLSNSLQWIDAEDIRKNPEIARSVLTLSGTIERAQNLATWFRKNGLIVSPILRKNALAKLECNLDDAETNSFDRLIREGAIPRKLTRKANDQTEVRAFQAELNGSVVATEGNASVDLDTSASESVAVSESVDISQKTENELDVNSKPEKPERPKTGDETESLVSTTSVVSNLIDEMLKVSGGFKNLLETSSEVLEQKKEELKDAEKYVVDLYHMIEFCDLNAADGFRIYKVFQGVLRKRRVLKNEIFALDLFVKKMQSGATIENVTTFIKAVENIPSRQYRLRICSKEEVQKIIRSEKTISELFVKS